jgi:hypothetical protein
VATQFTNPFIKIEITQTIPMATKHLIQQTIETGTGWTPDPSWGEPYQKLVFSLFPFNLKRRSIGITHYTTVLGNDDTVPHTPPHQSLLPLPIQTIYHPPSLATPNKIFPTKALNVRSYCTIQYLRRSDKNITGKCWS